jgi:hypothetical protein
MRAMKFNGLAVLAREVRKYRSDRRQGPRDDDAIKQHARHLFTTIYKPGAYAIRIVDSAGREVHLWVPEDDDDPRA